MSIPLGTRVDRDSRHNPILKQQLRRYGPRSIFPQESPFRARFGAFYPHPAHQSAPTAEWATDSGHCSLASRPTPNQRGEVVCRPSPAGYRLPPTAEFPINSPARGGGRGALVRLLERTAMASLPLPRFVIGNSPWRRFLQGAAHLGIGPPGSYHRVYDTAGLDGWLGTRS